MTRLSLQVVYLWRHVSSTAPPFISWWPNLEILFGPLHRSSPFIGELRCQSIQIEHGPYIAERTQNAVYIERCLCVGYENVITLYLSCINDDHLLVGRQECCLVDINGKCDNWPTILGISLGRQSLRELKKIRGEILRLPGGSVSQTYWWTKDLASEGQTKIFSIARKVFWN
jgi:hypothetical protein